MNPMQRKANSADMSDMTHRNAPPERARLPRRPRLLTYVSVAALAAVTCVIPIAAVLVYVTINGLAALNLDLRVNGKGALKQIAGVHVTPSAESYAVKVFPLRASLTHRGAADIGPLVLTLGPPAAPRR